MLHLPASWYFDTSLTSLISKSQVCCNTATFCIAAIFVKIAIQPAVGCYNSWADLRCSSCSPLAGKSLWNVTILPQDVAFRRRLVEKLGFSCVFGLPFWFGCPSQVRKLSQRLSSGRVTLDLRTYVDPGRTCRLTYAVQWSGIPIKSRNGLTYFHFPALIWQDIAICNSRWIE